MEPGVTSIDDLLRNNGNSNGGRTTDTEVVDSILNELNSAQVVTQQQQQQAQAQAQEQAQAQSQAQAQQAQAHAQQQSMMRQQEQLENLVRANQEKDQMLRELTSGKEGQDGQENVTQPTLLTEFKPTIISFILVLIFTLPILNKFICSSIGIEENTIFSILRTFIICILFFLINKFI